MRGRIPRGASRCHTPHFPAQMPLLDRVPELRVVLEHITTAEAAEFVQSAPASVAATVTPQHMLLNRNALFVVGPLTFGHWLQAEVGATVAALYSFPAPRPPCQCC